MIQDPQMQPLTFGAHFYKVRQSGHLIEVIEIDHSDFST